MFMQNLIKLSAAVLDISSSQRKGEKNCDDAECNMVVATVQGTVTNNVV